MRYGAIGAPLEEAFQKVNWRFQLGRLGKIGENLLKSAFFWVNPSNISVRALKYNIQTAMAGVMKDNHTAIGQTQF